MKNLASKRQLQHSIIYSHLCSVWNVDADHTYSITKRPGIPESDYIAVRTLSGCGVLTEFNQQKHILRENTLGIFRSSDVSCYNACSQGWRFYWFRFDYNAWQDPYNIVYDLSISPSEQKSLECCFSHLNSNNEYECALAESIFNYLLSDWLIRINEVHTHNISLKNITNVLDKGMQNKQKIQTIAREMGMCERSFRELVHQTTGLSPKEYMKKLKMETAMDLLQTTELSVSDISAQLNFENPFYFSRVFKKHFGISPSTAREFTKKSP